MVDSHKKQSGGRAISRRTAIHAGVIGGVVGLAGCMGGDDDDGATDGDLGSPVPPVEYTWPNPDYDPERYEVGNMLVDTIEEGIGLEIEENPVDGDRYVDSIIYENDYELGMINKASDPNRIDPDAYVHGSLHTDGFENWVEYSSEEYDEIADAQRDAVDPDERQEYIFEAQEYVAENQPYSPYLYPPWINPYNHNLLDPETIVESVDSPAASFWSIQNIEPETEDNELVITSSNNPDTMNPLNVPGATSRRMVSMFHDTLLKVDENGEVRDWLAEDWEWVEDTVIRFDIRDDHTWHDGEPVTMEDIQWSYEFMRRESPFWGSDLERIVDIEVIDDSTMEFTFEEPFAPAEVRIFGDVFIVPPQLWEEVDEEEEDPAGIEPDEPFGSGPWEFESFVLNEEFTVTRNDDHFEPPNADRMISVETADTGSAIRMLETDEAALGDFGLTTDAAQDLEDADNVGLREGHTVGYAYLMYHHDVEQFQDPAMRRAIAYCIPRTDINQTLYDDMGIIGHNIIAPHNEFWHNPDTQEYYMDFEAAREELEEAGYGWDEDGNLHYPPE